mgnify:CR=1 FL=1
MLHPGRRLLVLSAGPDTPGEVARLLTNRGFGASAVSVLGDLGSAHETRVDALARLQAGREGGRAAPLELRPQDRLAGRVPREYAVAIGGDEAWWREVAAGAEQAVRLREGKFERRASAIVIALRISWFAVPSS